MNDVALTIIGGTLQKYLTHHNEPVRGALVAWCPVVVDQPGRQEGNFVSMRPSDLHADETDPLERLKRVRASTAQVKELDTSFGISEATASLLGVAPVQLMDPNRSSDWPASWSIAPSSRQAASPPPMCRPHRMCCTSTGTRSHDSSPVRS